jgi:hypothetical protein
MVNERDWVNLLLSLKELHMRVCRLGSELRVLQFHAGLSPWLRTKGASVSVVRNNPRKPGPIEREVKLKELGKMIRGL